MSTVSFKQKKYKFFVCIDFPDDLINTSFDQKYLLRLFSLFKSWGMSRIYWIYALKHNEGYLDFLPCEGLTDNAEITYRNIGEFLPAAVRAAHGCKMEIYAVYKPFDLAFNETFPFGSRGALKYGKTDSISGKVYWAANGFAKLQKMRIERRKDDVPEDIEGKVIKKIRLVSNNRKSTRIKKTNIEIFVSDDNGTYKRYQQRFDFTEKIERNRRVIILNNLNIPNKYFSINTPFKDDKGTFKNRLSKLVEIYDNIVEKIPFTYGLISRKDRYSGEVKISKDIPREGYVFNKYYQTYSRTPTPVNDDGCILDNSRGYIAFAKGKERYVVGALSPGYKEVQNYWLRHIRECLETGVDGIDLRIANHNRNLEWENYGFEKPIVKEYQKRYGVNILKEPFDQKNRLDIIARYYTDFYRKAAKLIRRVGKKVQLHIGTPALGRGKYPYMGMKWEWEKWIKEGLVDEITLKDVWPGDKKFTGRVYRLSSKRNIPLYCCPYLNNIPGGPKWEKFFRESLINSMKMMKQNGFILYEAAGIVKEEKRGKIRILFPAVPKVIKEFATEQ